MSLMPHRIIFYLSDEPLGTGPTSVDVANCTFATFATSGTCVKLSIVSPLGFCESNKVPYESLVYSTAPFMIFGDTFRGLRGPANLLINAVIPFGQ